MRNRFLIAVLLGLSACTQNKLEVEGSVIGYPEGIFCLIGSNGDTVMQARVEKGRFRAQEELEPGMYWFAIGAYRAQKYVTPGKIKIEGTVDENYTLSCEVRMTGLEEDDRLKEAGWQIERECRQEWEDARQAETDTNRLKENNHGAFVIRYSERRAAIAVPYVQKETNAYFAAALALQNCGMYYEAVKMLYDALSEDGKSSLCGQQIKQLMEQKKSTANGEQAPDFEAVNETGETIRLSDYRGKVVVLDVWASWCAPCRNEIPYMKKVYEQFACPELVFMSVAMDDKKDSWLKATDSENIPWLNLWDPAGFKQSKLRSSYGFSVVPFIMVVDRSGKIVGKGLIRNELADCLGKLLMN